MANTMVLTDSAANIPPEWIEKYPLRTLPHNIHWDNDSFLDGISITPAEFYKRLSGSKTLPTTSQPSAQDFLNTFEELDSQADGIVVPLISSGISGTVDSATSAARQFTRVPVEIVDTRVTAVGQTIVALKAARAAAEGKSIQEVLQAAEDVVSKLGIYFAVDTLEYLHRGGRIGGASRFLGTMLNFKPILYMNPEGFIDALERTRTSSKAIQRLIELAVEKADGKPSTVGILHADRPQLAEEVSQTLKQKIDCIEVIITELSPVISVHVGPGTIGIAVYPEAE